MKTDWIPSYPSKTSNVLAMMIGLVGSLAILATPFVARAEVPQYCTYQTPYAPYRGVCTGNGTWCNLGLNCTPVPGVQGTWGPGGYTPCTTRGGC